MDSATIDLRGETRPFMVQAHTATALLVAWEGGDGTALERLLVILEPELRRLARRHMARERKGHTLQATALINEAYLRLVEGRDVRCRSRVHFFALAARVIRHILVDHARAKGNLKRGGSFERVSMTEALDQWSPPARDVLALDDALEALATIDPRRSRVVELRFFGGLSVEETAGVLKVSPETVMRDWKLARVWLRRELHRPSPNAT